MLETASTNSWNQFLEFIQSRCSSAEFENWIAPIQLIHFSPDEVKLSVPNIFVQEYLLDNFKDVLAHFLPLRHTGEPAICFVVETEKKFLPNPSNLEEVKEEPVSHELRLNL
jgi:chromosomal replication initiator protein